MQPDMIYAYVGGITKSYDDKGYLHVKGLASDATLDLDDQRCDPAWLDSAMPQWFKTGNVREMHQLRAVGKATELSKSGSGYAIEAKIVDAQASEKVAEDIYTGFSIGIKGARVDKSPEALKMAPGGIINGGRIVEVSLVDLPANPSAVLELAKTVGDNLVKTEVIDSGEVPCPTCNGTGEVMGDDGAMTQCDTCEGTGYDVLDFRPTDNGGDKDDGSIGANESEKASKPDPDCPTCKGTGKIRDGHVDCPDCMQKTVEGDIEKKPLTSKEINDLPDSDFAYIEPGGKKDDEGKTVPRSNRHFPLVDAAHVRNALARAPQSSFGEKAMPKIKEAAKKFGIDSDKAAEADDGYKPKPYKRDADETVQCPKCERFNDSDAHFCDQCGFKLDGAQDVKVSEAAKSSRAEFEKLAEVLKAAADDYTHDPAQLAAVRDGLIAVIEAELEEFKTGDDERFDVVQLTDALNTFLSWWQDEFNEGETASPFGKDTDAMSFISLGMTPDIVKAATAEDATDDAKTAFRDELRKTLGLEELETIKGASAALLQEVTDLKEQLADVKTMAAPKGISLRATQFQAARFAEVEQLQAKAAQYRESAGLYADVQTKGQFMAEAAKLEAEAATIRKSLEGDN